MNDDTTVPDQQGLTRVSRIFTVRNANAPTEIHWLYQPTIFRTEIPLGLSLNGLNPNSQLTPALPGAAALRVSDTGPGSTITKVKFPPDGSFIAGEPLRWDILGKGLFPVHPGIYQVTWPDGNVSRQNVQDRNPHRLPWGYRDAVCRQRGCRWLPSS